MKKYLRIQNFILSIFFILLTSCAQFGDSGLPATPYSRESQAAATQRLTPVNLTPDDNLGSAVTETPTSTGTPSPTTGASETPLPPPVPPEVETYLEEAYTILYENSIRRDVIDWESFRARFEESIDSVRPETIDDAHTIIWEAVNRLGDNHSQFLLPGEVDLWTGDHPVPEARFDAQLLEDRYGYISVPSFSSGSDESNNAFATSMQAAIAEIEENQPCGWIIDLRQNYGGNMWPMVVGVGPILGEGQFGENIRADGDTIPWLYQDGQGWWGDELLAQTNTQPVELHQELSPAAILLGRGTASAGEAVAIAFKGRPHTRFFGQDTAGLTTAPEPYPLRDGAIIFLSDSYMGDRNGKAYRTIVSPDEEVYLGGSLDAPVEWLASQASCGK